MNFVAIDFETANEKRMSACSMGLVFVENNVIVRKKDYLIKPTPNIYNSFNTSMHKLSERDTENEPTFDVLWPEIQSLLENKIVVAHGAAFDMSVIKEAGAHFNLPLPNIKVVCTSILYKNIFEDAKSSDLMTVVKRLNLEYVKHHDALADAEMAANVLIALANFKEYDDIDKLLSDHKVRMGVCVNGKYKSCIKKSDKSGLSEYMDKMGHVQLSGDVLKKDLTNADPNNPFYDKNVLITGLFAIDRMDLALRLKGCGANLQKKVSKKLDYIIVGNKPGPAKMQQVEDFNKDGARIQILTESQINTILKLK